jgi:hypothetical protein
MSDFQPNRILVILAEHQVDFVVIGGVAAIAHGSQYITRDVDVLFLPSPENCERLSHALQALHAEYYARPSNNVGRRRTWQIEAEQAARRIDAASLQLWNIYHFTTALGDLDCMVTVPGALPYERVRQRATMMQLRDAMVCIVDLDDLIAMKRAAGRPKDLLTVDELLELRQLIEHDLAVESAQAEHERDTDQGT